MLDVYLQTFLKHQGAATDHNIGRDVNAAGAVCEEQFHHADFDFGWGRAKVTIWTHKIDGLTESDFVLASKLDQL